jgi:hypothetical protein
VLFAIVPIPWTVLLYQMERTFARAALPRNRILSSSAGGQNQISATKAAFLAIGNVPVPPGNGRMIEFRSNGRIRAFGRMGRLAGNASTTG